MKSLKKFILESFEDKEINNLIVFYNIKDGEYVIVQAPETYSEDDLTMYLGDLWFNQFPGGKDNKQSKNLLGENLDKIIDVHLEYDSFEHTKDKQDNAIEWDNKYDIKNSDNSELEYFILSNVKYVIQFESFNIKSENETDISSDLKEIFKSLESSALNKYPVELEYDSFEYDK